MKKKIKLLIKITLLTSLLLVIIYSASMFPLLITSQENETLILGLLYLGLLLFSLILAYYVIKWNLG